MKTDLAKTLSISGHKGLYNYVGQGRGGVIAEELATGRRTFFDARNRITTLEDISIYTSEGEIKLKEVFLKLKEVLGDAPVPSPKDPSDKFKELFAKAIPDYDEDRFYVSHMKKVAEWYDCLAKYASFDFVEQDEEEVSEEPQSEDKANE